MKKGLKKLLSILAILIIAGLVFTSTGVSYALETDTSQETKTVSFTKVWDDEGNAYNTRPNKITIDVFRDGGEEVFSSYEITGDSTADTWTKDLEGLPLYKDGSSTEESVYTVKERSVDNYEASEPLYEYSDHITSVSDDNPIIPAGVEDNGSDDACDADGVLAVSSTDNNLHIFKYSISPIFLFKIILSLILPLYKISFCDI